MTLSNLKTQQFYHWWNNNNLDIGKWDTPHFNKTQKTTHEFDNEIPILQMPKSIDFEPWWIQEFLQSSQYERYFFMRDNHHIHPKQQTIQHTHWKKPKWPFSRSLSLVCWSKYYNGIYSAFAWKKRHLQQTNSYKLYFHEDWKTTYFLLCWKLAKPIVLPTKQLLSYLHL